MTIPVIGPMNAVHAASGTRTTPMATESSVTMPALCSAGQTAKSSTKNTMAASRERAPKIAARRPTARATGFFPRCASPRISIVIDMAMTARPGKLIRPSSPKAQAMRPSRVVVVGKCSGRSACAGGGTGGAAGAG